VVLNSEKVVSKSCDLGQEFNSPLVQLFKIDTRVKVGLYFVFLIIFSSSTLTKSQISVMIRTCKSNSSEDPTCFKSWMT
jgi:hypothetical protein